MSADAPNIKYDHVYAIVRIDKQTFSGSVPDKNFIVIKKVVRSREEAEQEVQRLNNLNAGKGCEYFYQITRLERLRSTGTETLTEKAKRNIAH
jgi:hypothetical protein